MEHPANKPTRSCICFDMADFYPSVTEELVEKALMLTVHYDDIAKKEKNIILLTKQSVLFDGNSTWSKKESNSLVDVTGQL